MCSRAAAPRAAPASFPKRIAAERIARTGAGVYRFRPDNRLRRPREFKAVFANGRRVSGTYLSAVVSAAPGDQARLGLAIAKRAVPHAVDRNRIKRQIRESFRQHLLQLPPVDIVFNARRGASEADNAQLRLELEHIWKRTRQRWGSC